MSKVNEYVQRLISLGTAGCKYQPILYKKQYFDSPGNRTMVALDPIDHYGHDHHSWTWFEDRHAQHSQPYVPAKAIRSASSSLGTNLTLYFFGIATRLVGSELPWTGCHSASSCGLIRKLLSVRMKTRYSSRLASSEPAHMRYPMP